MFGTSTAALEDKRNWASLLEWQPEVVEFYNYPSSDLSAIESFCRANGVAIALHTPTPYDLSAPLRRFAPTGPDPEEAKAALDMSLATVRCAADLNAVHAVVHFPSAYKDTTQPITSQAVEAFLDPLMDEAQRLNVSVLVENLSSHPSFFSPDHYLALAHRYDNLSFCLDFGHAWDLPEIGIEGFARVLGTKIRSCHVYNRQRGVRRGHTPVHPSQSPAEGWIDIDGAVKLLTELCAIRTWILEPDPVAKDDWPRATEGALWLRDLVSSGR